MIEVRNLVKCYGNFAAVDDLSFKVETGKVVGFLGPNGAGKSTTMNMITGYIAPTSGNVLIDGINILEEPEKAKAKIGYLPEIPPLYSDLRVGEYLHFVAELKRVARAERDMTVYQVMKKTKIEDVAGSLICHLSKGYKQRVGLAGAMIGQPDILILDEPTVGLDPGQIIEIRELIRELSKDHTILLSSHIMQEISAVCDEIIIINEGRMVVCDTPENLIKRMVGGNRIYLLVRGDREKTLEVLKNIDGVERVICEESGEENAFGFTIYSREATGQARGLQGTESSFVFDAPHECSGQKEENQQSFSLDRDIREAVFYAMAEISSPILEMHSVHTTLEDVFLALTERGEK